MSVELKKKVHDDLTRKIASLNFFINHNKETSNYSICPLKLKSKSPFTEIIQTVEQPKFKLPLTIAKLANAPKRIGGKEAKLELNIVRLYQSHELLNSDNI